MMSRLDDDCRAVFCEEARQNLNDRMLSGPERYDQLDVLEGTIRILKGLLPHDPTLMKPYERRLYAGLLLNQVRIDSHRGSSDPKPFQVCLDFLDSYGHTTFENLLELMQERIEVVLSRRYG